MADMKSNESISSFALFLGISAAETVAILRKAYKKQLNKTKDYEWFSRFNSGRMAIEDELEMKRPSIYRMENILKIHNAIISNRRRTIDELKKF